MVFGALLGVLVIFRKDLREGFDAFSTFQKMTRYALRLLKCVQMGLKYALVIKVSTAGKLL